MGFLERPCVWKFGRYRLIFHGLGLGLWDGCSFGIRPHVVEFGLFAIGRYDGCTLLGKPMESCRPGATTPD